MPGVGPRSAERIALWMVGARSDQPEQISRAIAETRQAIRSCKLCGFFSAGEICEICADSSRSTELLCVVEQPTDILPLEKTNVFRGDIILLEGRFLHSIILVPTICALKNYWNASIRKRLPKSFSHCLRM